jgi:hypothetical protein
MLFDSLKLYPEQQPYNRKGGFVRISMQRIASSIAL